jgi:hypothetical protein
MSPDEREHLIVYLHGRLDATDADLDASELWLFVAEYISATLAEVRAGRASDAAIDRCARVCKDYDYLRSRSG